MRTEKPSSQSHQILDRRQHQNYLGTASTTMGHKATMLEVRSAPSSLPSVPAGLQVLPRALGAVVLGSIPVELWEIISALPSTLGVLWEMCRNACRSCSPSLEGNQELTPATLDGPVWGCTTSSQFGESFLGQE